jgi:hypothetical protein
MTQTAILKQRVRSPSTQHKSEDSEGAVANMSACGNIVFCNKDDTAKRIRMIECHLLEKMNFKL